MHASNTPTAAIERMNAVRGGAKPIAINPSKTAHIIIDLQVAFMAPGARSEVPVARDIVPNVNKISKALRDVGGLNIFVRFTVDPSEPNYWASWYDRMSDDARDSMSKVFSAGAEQYQLWPELDIQRQDLVVDKTRFSAFIPGTCKLNDILKDHSIDTLIVTGTLTNACCESTVRDAMQLGYKVLFVQDGNATWDDVTHNATLANMVIFSDVCTTDDVISRIGQGSSNRVAA